MTVNGVLFHTDESQMTSGLIEFYVKNADGDYALCPDTSGVNINGGVFNCGLTGVSMFIYCW